MAKDHGPSVKNDKQYEGLRKKGMSKSRAAAIANSPGSSSRGGKSSGSSQSKRAEQARVAAATRRKRRRPGARAARSQMTERGEPGPTWAGQPEA